MKIDMPPFDRNKYSSWPIWIENQQRTARFISSLWIAASKKQRQEPMFLQLLVQLGWITKHMDSVDSPTIKWRNKKIAEYLSLDAKEALSVQALKKVFPRLNPPSFLNKHTGITNFYSAFRPPMLSFIEENAASIAKIFKIVASPKIQTEQKIKLVFNALDKIGARQTEWGKNLPIIKGLTPVLACLDPHRRFPILNNQTESLLKIIGETADADGATKLSKLIGHFGIGIKNSAELDVYSSNDFTMVRRKAKKTKRINTNNEDDQNYRGLEQKDEMDSYAKISKGRKKITKEHNKLTNSFKKALEWTWTIEEGRFDALIRNWIKPNRHLLIEAKTSSEGTDGRTQIRQAIGQLFDYRHKCFSKKKGNIDLAVLLPQKPSGDVIGLLGSLGIEVIWFNAGKLTGTPKLQHLWGEAT